MWITKNTESTKQSHSCFLLLFKETFSCITIKKRSWTVIGRLWLRWSLTRTEVWEECTGGNLGTITYTDLTCTIATLWFVSCLVHSCWAVCADTLCLLVLWSHTCRHRSRSLAVRSGVVFLLQWVGFQPLPTQLYLFRLFSDCTAVTFNMLRPAQSAALGLFLSENCAVWASGEFAGTSTPGVNTHLKWFMPVNCQSFFFCTAADQLISCTWLAAGC